MDRAIAEGIHPTLTAIAARLDVAPSTLSRAVTGASVPGEDLLARIRYVFGAAGFDEIVSVSRDDDDQGDDATATPDVW
jgi:transcriptional regulator with XRE-family HTH domain